MITARGKHRRMDKATEEDVGGLAQPLWESAARPYGMALDFWLMAEQMVLEMMAASARIQDAASSSAASNRRRRTSERGSRGKSSRACGVAWESAGRQFEWLRIIGFRRSDTC